MRRADYEVYTFRRGSKQYWAFDVEYFGHYLAQSEKEILTKVAAVKQQVADRLKEIEILNAAYYAKLNRDTDELLKELKEYRQHKVVEDPPERPKEVIIREIRDMLLMGATNIQVLESIPDTTLRTISHVRHHLVAKKLL